MYDYPIKKDEEKKPKILPFKVHFSKKVIPGKSYIRIGLPKGTPHTVTEKFYQKEHYELNPKEIDEICEQLKTTSPKERYNGEIVTENQKYGWYYDVKFTDLDRNDRRLYFGQKMDHFIKLSLITMDKKTQ